ncbi:MAG TPA: EamA family transporter [Blastocatellia bacterium]|nr:EamA family transporter [Blastocatellia bacterium]
MKTLLVIFIAIFAQVLGDVCLTKGARSVGEINAITPGEIFAAGVQIFTNQWIWTGIGILLVFYLLNLVALSWADLTYVIPVSAFGYVLNALMSKYLLGEHVSLLRWVGTTVIFVGVALVSLTEQRTATETQTAGADAA